jgi:hypothetical protein
MRVSGLGNSPGYGQGPSGADRTNKDGQRRGGQGQDQQPKKQDEDEVDIHAPEPDGDAQANPPVKPVKPAPPTAKPGPLDLSA